MNLERLIAFAVAEPLAKEITNVAKQNERQVAQVGGQEIVVWSLVFNRPLKGLACGLAGVQVLRRKQRAKLSLDALPSLHLLGRLRLEQRSGRLDGVRLTSRSGQRNGGQ